mmetsp:Transcript_12855/g.38814  ORF Transcript_12855/g.38814 Transcript_12855/m.38814 type:complete len:242 (+) Transcript_12855:7176-7901(+)
MAWLPAGGAATSAAVPAASGPATAGRGARLAPAPACTARRATTTAAVTWSRLRLGTLMWPALGPPPPTLQLPPHPPGCRSLPHVRCGQPLWCPPCSSCWASCATPCWRGSPSDCSNRTRTWCQPSWPWRRTSGWSPSRWPPPSWRRAAAWSLCGHSWCRSRWGPWWASPSACRWTKPTFGWSWYCLASSQGCSFTWAALALCPRSLPSMTTRPSRPQCRGGRGSGCSARCSSASWWWLCCS